MPVFFDRKTGEMHDVQSGSPEHLGHLYGSGQEGFGRMFPGGNPIAGTPWNQAGGIRGRAPYDRDRVRAMLQHPARGMSEVDPRGLTSTQPEVTRSGVEHYMDPNYQRTGQLFADRENAGNIHPVVYGRTHPTTGRQENLILSGHHRATAALLQGKPLKAHFIEGGYGAEYPKP